MNYRLPIAFVLLVLAVFVGSAVWRLHQEAKSRGEAPTRSDYVLENYQLLTLDSHGLEAFTVTGPYLERDPGGKSLTLRTPKFTFPDKQGGHWQASSDLAWVADKGVEVRLINHVVMTGPPTPTGDRTRFNSAGLQIFPKKDLARSDDPVTITRTNSILRGRGLRADLKAHRFQLLADVKGRYAPAHH